MNHFITTESVTSHALCPRRAFFVIRGKPEGSVHDYERVVDERAARRWEFGNFTHPQSERESHWLTAASGMRP